MQDKDKKKLLKRARAKYISKSIAYKLYYLDKIEPDFVSPLKKAYMNTMYCNDVLFEQYGKLSTNYCKNRWCLVCCRNRIGKLINGYKEPLKDIKDPYFVTLTAQTIPANQLSQRIDDMIRIWRKIYVNAQKNKREIHGIRKLECTARPNDLYHPHFHILINGKENAEWLIKQWLKQWLEFAKRQAQDMRPANENSTLELFKYFTKLITRVEKAGLFNDKDKREIMHPQKLDTIFVAMRKRRVYQPFGKIKDIGEEAEEIPIIEIEFGKIFKWVNSDWFDVKTGEALTGWLPNEAIKELTK